MANPKHLKILKQGIEVWNKWRETKAGIAPNLSGVNLKGKILSGINFSNTNLFRADFSDAICRDSNLEDAQMKGVNIAFCDFSNANFRRANLTGAQLFFGNFTRVNFRAAHLQSVTFAGAEVGHANFEKAVMADTTFSNTDLSQALHLSSIIHIIPSTIGVDTLFKSQGKIPEIFLRGAGVPEGFISYLPSLIGAADPIQWHSCFISYSTQDEEFANRLHARMREAGLRVWFAPEDMKGGDYFFEQIERAIQLHDRLLLVLSEDSIQSKWVEREIRKARKVERTEKRRKLFPITLTDYATLKKWECLDSDTGEDLAEEVRKYHIPDFSHWKNHDAFEAAFARLEKDLRTSLGKR